MKKFLFFIILSAFLISESFSQYFNTTQIGIMMGIRPVNERNPNPYNYDARTEFFPSVTMTNGKRFDEHWAAGIGVGYERFDRDLFPLFVDVRYTLWDNKVSPFFTFKTGYSSGNFKKKHYDNLTLYHEPHSISDAYYKKDGGLMLHPEMGVRIPLSENADLMFTVAYRYQKIKSTVTQNLGSNKWEHKESLNRLSFGIGVTFR